MGRAQEAGRIARPPPPLLLGVGQKSRLSDQQVCRHARHVWPLWRSAGRSRSPPCLHHPETWKKKPPLHFCRVAAVYAPAHLPAQLQFSQPSNNPEGSCRTPPPTCRSFSSPSYSPPSSSLMPPARLNSQLSQSHRQHPFPPLTCTTRRPRHPPPPTSATCTSALKMTPNQKASRSTSLCL